MGERGKEGRKVGGSEREREREWTKEGGSDGGAWKRGQESGRE